MKKIGFIGVYDKTDVILSIAKICAVNNKKVLVIDNTLTQKCRYIVPTINPTKTYITTFEDIDIAIGFENFNQIKQYIGLEENEQLEYDFLFIDTDSFEGVTNFGLQSADKNYLFTSFDIYHLKKNIEILSKINLPVHITKVFFSQYMSEEEEEYFDYLALGLCIVWEEKKVYFTIGNTDYSSITENQRIGKIKFKNLSDEYKKNIKFFINDIYNEIDDKMLKTIFKEN